MKYEEYEQIIEKVKFEENWLLDLDNKNELNSLNIKIAMSGIRHILWEILKGEKTMKGSD